jgi:hypothetical protein
MLAKPDKPYYHLTNNYKTLQLNQQELIKFGQKRIHQGDQLKPFGSVNIDDGCDFL